MTRRKPLDKAIRAWLQDLAKNRADMGLAQTFAEDLLATRKALRACLRRLEANVPHSEAGVIRAARRCLPECQKEKP